MFDYESGKYIMKALHVSMFSRDLERNVPNRFEPLIVREEKGVERDEKKNWSLVLWYFS